MKPICFLQLFWDFFPKIFELVGCQVLTDFTKTKQNKKKKKKKNGNKKIKTKENKGDHFSLYFFLSVIFLLSTEAPRNTFS